MHLLGVGILTAALVIFLPLFFTFCCCCCWLTLLNESHKNRARRFHFWYLYRKDKKCLSSFEELPLYFNASCFSLSKQANGNFIHDWSSAIKLKWKDQREGFHLVVCCSRFSDCTTCSKPTTPWREHLSHECWHWYYNFQADDIACTQAYLKHPVKQGLYTDLE